MGPNVTYDTNNQLSITNIVTKKIYLALQNPETKKYSIGACLFGLLKKGSSFSLEK